MTDIVQYQEPQTALSIRAQVNLIQEVMQAVMKKEVHYGTIPGTPKPTLFKPGAEVLCATFRIAPSYRIEDLSTGDVARYRVVCVGTHQATGIVLGEGAGACSSGEEKYKWRKAYDKEWDATPEDRRRVKHGRDYSNKQVRTEPADLDNTILKMACKRAQVAMTLNVTAASDIFTQDIEDLPEELRHAEDAPPPEVKKPQSKSSKTAPQPESSAPSTSQTASSSANPAPAGAAVHDGPTLTEGQQKILRARMNGTVTDDMVAAKFGAPLTALKGTQFNEIAKWIGEQQ
jgi:hypothetical protein